MRLSTAFGWLRDHAEDAWALLGLDPDFKRRKKDPRNGL
jgi:hypothetical protein